MKVDPTKLQCFAIIRDADATGISGTGRVLDGVIFHTGQVVICWHSENQSITIFQDWAAFENVHLKAHPENRSKIQFFEVQSGTENQQM